jgi:hypothetical protein
MKSHLSRLVEAIEHENGGVFAGPDADGHLLLAEYRGDRFEPPLVLDFTEEEFDSAVLAAGRSSTQPGVSAAKGGYRLLSVHMYESLSGERAPTRRVYLSGGQLWAE